MKQRYQDLKHSGVEWLGEIPAHWEVKTLRRAGDAVIGLTYEPGDVVDKEEGLLVLRASNVRDGHIVFGDDVFVKRKVPDALITKTGDILICSRSGSRDLIGKNARVDNNSAGLTFGTFMTVFRSASNHYLFYVLNSTLFDYQSGAFLTSTINQLTLGNLYSFQVPLPPQNEQLAIANFLDRKTAEIDALVAKKRALIEKLKEKRSALISRTVTCGLPPEAARAAGLNPNPRLKQSGVEWLGELPAHWGAAQFRRFTHMITSGSRGWAEYYTDEGQIFVRIGNLTRNSINVDLTDVQHVDPPFGAEGERTRIKTGDLLFSITAYLGSVAVASTSTVGGYINQHIALVRLDKARLLPEFAAFTTLADIGQSQLSGFGYGGTKVQLSLDDVKSLWLPIPPLPEQLAIADFLDRETAKIDSLIAKVEQAIERLQEYRTALITAAVTGKIDVRQAEKAAGVHA